MSKPPFSSQYILKPPFSRIASNLFFPSHSKSYNVKIHGGSDMSPGIEVILAALHEYIE